MYARIDYTHTCRHAYFQSAILYIHTMHQLHTSDTRTTLATHTVRKRFDNGTHTMTFVIRYFYATKCLVFYVPYRIHELIRVIYKFIPTFDLISSYRSVSLPKVRPGT